MSQTPAELDFINGRKFTREEILAVFGVPAPLLALESATYNNLETAKTQFWEDTIIPYLLDEAAALTFRLASSWDSAGAPQGAEANLRLVPDLGAVPDSLNGKSQVAVRLVSAGWPVNMVNRRLGLGMEDVPGGDQPRAPTPTSATQPALANAARGPQLRKSAELRALQWKKKDAQREQWAGAVADQVKKHLNAEGQAVAGAATQGAGAAMEAVNLAAWVSLMHAVYEPTMQHFGALEGEQLAGAGFQFQLTDSLKNWIQAAVAEKVKGITDTTRQAIKDAVENAMQNPSGATPDVAKAIRDLYDGWQNIPGGQSRAQTIARTETGAAANRAAWESGQQVSAQLGVTVLKTWLSSRDNRVREEHAALDGETVPNDETFSDGSMYPDAPNCRCDIQQTIEGGEG